MTEVNLPFQVGQTIETKSFITGYRGAWFQCKILDIITKKGILVYKLEYVNYPDEKIHVSKVYEKPRRGTKFQLMVRPTYPPLYHESEFFKIKRDLGEPLVVVHGSWKVGDLVDWWKDDCYWSGKIVKLIDNETCQIELHPKPIGEGSTYEGLCKDVRPSLNWSPEDGWKLPLTWNGRKCAKLIKPKDQGKEIADVCETGKKETTKATQTGKEETTKGTQQVKGNGGLRLNIMESDSIEAAVLDIEELIVRIEWLKGKLNPDGAGAKSHWKYEDYRASASGM